MSFKVLNPSGSTAVEVKDAYVDFTVGPNEVVDIEDLYQGELWRLTFSTMDPTLSPPYTPPTDADGGALYTAISTGALIRVKNDGTTQIPWSGTAASVVMQDLTYTAGEAMECGNNYTIGYTSGGTAGSEVVSISGYDVTVQIQNGVSTATQVKAAIEANPTTNALFVVTVTGVGSNPQYAGAVEASKIIQDLTYAADSAGVAGNLINLTYVDPSAPSQTLGVVVTGNDIVVTLATDAGSVITTTADDIKTLLDGTPAAAALIDITVSGTGTNLQTAQAQTFLTGGVDATNDFSGGTNDPFADAIWLWHLTKYQWEALAGSYGCPSDINRYVTEGDPRANAGSDTQPVTSTTTDGTIDNFARTDHTHQGIHGLKANGVGTQRYGDLVLQQGTGVTITDNGLGTFTFDVAPAVTTELQVSEGTGLVADYNAGKATFNGTEYLIAAGTVTVTDNATNYVYVDIDGTVKSNTTGFPPNTMPLAQVVAASGNITSVTDYRSFINQSLVWGVDGDISTVEPDDAAAAGSSEKYARADHIHAVAADVPMFIGETGSGSANAEGDSTSFARADHEHKWQLVSSFVGLPATPVDGQVVWAKYGVYNGLFYYDSTRAKWLSMAENVKHWNSGTNVSTVTVNLISNIDDTQQDNDYPNPYPITITGLLGCQSNVIATDNATKFEVAKFDLTTGTLTQDVADVTLNTVGSRAVRNMAVNVDVGDLTVLSARRLRTGTATGNITRPALSVFYRVRLSA
jgi:hypothetical protein